MLAILFLVGGALLGACVVRRVLRGVLGGAESVLWGVVAGWMLATLLVYGLARWQGRLTFAVVAWANEFVWLAALLLLVTELRRGWRAVFAWRAQYAGLAFVVVAFAPVFWRLFSTRMLPRGAGGIYSGGNSWFDMAFHVSLTTSFLYGQNFPPAYTLLPPAPLLYPFMPDFQTSTLVVAGLDLQRALVWTGVLLALATAGLLYFFALRIARSRLAASFACFLFMLNGGLGFVYLFEDWRASGKGFFEFWRALPVNYANQWGRDIHWVNLIADGILPQRSLLYGLPVALMVFTLFAVVWKRRDKEGRSLKDEGQDEEGRSSKLKDEGARASTTHVTARAGATRVPEATGAARMLAAASTTRVLASAGVLAGVLPLFHSHTYFSLVFISVVLFTMRPDRRWLAFWAPAVVLAAPELFSAGVHTAEGGFIHIRFGWMMSEGSSFTLYMLRNFGVPLVLALPAWIVAPREWRTFYLAFLALFAFGLVFMLSPNVFDNVKLMHPWHAVNSVFVGLLLAKMATTRRLRLLTLPLVFLLLLASVASGLAALQRESISSSLLFTDEEVAAANYVRLHTEPRSLFLAAPVFNQPVLCLAGRAVVRGPTFWLWSHGYEFREREADVRRIYAGAPDALELLRYYQVDYIYLGDAERRDIRTNAGFFEKNFRAVYRSASVVIYDARTTPSDGSGDPARSPAPRELASRVERDPYALLADFPRTSFFVYRVFKVSYGRMPRRAEFMTAMGVVGRGLFEGRQDWKRKLEENRRAFVEGLTASEEFRGLYDPRTNEAFVALLLSNAGLDAKSFGGEALVRLLDAGEETRASALMRVAEDGGLYAREYDRAFVLTHFFGYLGRDPGDPPDRGLEGFDFWLRNLKRTGDYRGLSRAFLESNEYEQRSVR